MKNQNAYFVVGQLALAASILLSHFVKENGFVSFAIGLCTGLSIVLNIVLLVNYRRREKRDSI